MKKIIALLLAFCLTPGIFAGCGFVVLIAALLYDRKFE